MCINPQTIWIDRETSATVRCRDCWQCQREKMMDWVGRAIAEQKSSSRTLALTLTYAGDGPETRTLVYSDVQKFLKKLRFDGYKVRYLVAGEYGSQKGRAHWHLILFFKHKFPEVELDRRITWKYWDHGLVYFQNPDFRGFAYVLKYILKGKAKQEGHFGMSKKPPLGHEYLTCELVHRYVKAGLAPRDFKFSWPDVQSRRGKPLIFNMTGVTRRNFVDAFVQTWRTIHGGEPPYTEALEREMEKNFMQTPEGQELQEFKHELQTQDKKERTARIISRQPSKYKEWKREKQFKKDYYDYIHSRVAKKITVGDESSFVWFEGLFEEYPLNEECLF